MAFSYRSADRAARVRQEASAAAACCASSSTLAAARLGDPQLHRRAVQHPVGLDAADAVHRRLSRSSPNGPTAIRAQLPVRVPVVRRAHPRQPARTRRRRRLPPPGADEDFVKRVIGLPGDTLEVRGGMLILNGRPIPREQAAAHSQCRFRRNSPCRVVPPARRRWSALRTTAAPRASTPPSRDAAGRPLLPCLDQVDNPPRRQFRRRSSSRRPCVPDGRQSRRQPRQPLPADRGRDRLRAGRKSGRPGDS